MDKTLRQNLYQHAPRGYAAALVQDGLVPVHDMWTACIKAMSYDELRAMLDINEWSPRFLELDEEEAEEYGEG